jgi:hypothetical protein
MLYILRRTGKSKVFHLGHIDDHRRKALHSMHETNAYHVIADVIHPCAAHLQAVLTLFDPIYTRQESN